MREKICPNCGAVNKADDLMCSVCMTDLLNVSVKQNDDLTVIEKYDSLLVLEGDNFKIELKSNEEYIIGRHAHGAEYLSKNPYVSRKHAKIYFKNDYWYIQDLNSTNGVYINGEKVDNHIIKDGDTISFSTHVNLKARIKPNKK